MEIPVLKTSKGIFTKEPQGTATTTIIVGLSKSGKTHFLVEELNKLASQTRELDGLTRPLYDAIVIFSESLNAEPLQNLDPNLNVIFFKGYIPKYVLFLKKINDAVKNKFNFLIVLDDCIGSVSGKSLRGGTLPKQFLTFRNAKISSVALVQGCTLLEPRTRENAHQIIITRLKVKEQMRVCNDLLYDSLMDLFPEYQGKRVNKEELAQKFFGGIGSNIVYYDNLGHKLYIIPRKEFHAK